MDSKNDSVFVVEKPCPVCGQKTRVCKTKSRQIVLSTDKDFCVHYKDFNPYYYTIWVCEKCGYAADEKHFLTALPAAHKNKLNEFLTKRRVNFRFAEERTLPDAVASYRLAILYEEMLQTSLAYLGGLYLKLAWLYRLSDDKANEEANMIKAGELYDRSVMTERYPIGNLSDNTAQYLVGAIYYMIGDMERSTQYLSRLMGDNSLRMTEPNIYEKVRDLWQDIREIREKEQAAAARAKKAKAASADAKQGK